MRTRMTNRSDEGCGLQEKDHNLGLTHILGLNRTGGLKHNNAFPVHIDEGQENRKN